MISFSCKNKHTYLFFVQHWSKVFTLSRWAFKVLSAATSSSRSPMRQHHDDTSAACSLVERVWRTVTSSAIWFLCSNFSCVTAPIQRFVQETKTEAYIVHLRIKFTNHDKTELHHTGRQEYKAKRRTDHVQVSTGVPFAFFLVASA